MGWSRPACSSVLKGCSGCIPNIWMYGCSHMLLIDLLLRMTSSLYNFAVTLKSENAEDNAYFFFYKNASFSCLAEETA